MSNAIHCAFQDVSSFGPTRTSIGGSRRFIGENTHHLALYSLQLVWTTEH